ncbi:MULTISPECIES: hypothetical protein [unclassified Pseudomonas]|uniref:hypothetical protein n=1 Tax=unclassified Pseudomonas TaxID=196821 RepID=UPI000ABC8987|nr:MULTISPECIES: hypothetical protein [unclassified Pseudomonas]
MKNPVDIPDPDPQVTREESLEEWVDIEPEDSRQVPHLSAAHQDGLKDDGPA